jgi:hypothetical protein
MPFHIEGSRVVLEGSCSVEEASDLFQALIAIESPTFAIEKAEFVHTAIAQVLMATRGRLESRPADRALAACLESLDAAG